MKVNATLENVIERYPEHPGVDPDIRALMAPDEIITAVERLEEWHQSERQSPSPMQTEWDTLTRLEENLKSLEAANRQAYLDGLAAARGQRLLSSFLGARDGTCAAALSSFLQRGVMHWRLRFASALKVAGSLAMFSRPQ